MSEKRKEKPKRIPRWKQWYRRVVKTARCGVVLLAGLIILCFCSIATLVFLPGIKDLLTPDREIQEVFPTQPRPTATATAIPMAAPLVSRHAQTEEVSIEPVGIDCPVGTLENHDTRVAYLQCDWPDELNLDKSTISFSEPCFSYQNSGEEINGLACSLENENLSQVWNCWVEFTPEGGTLYLRLDCMRQERVITAGTYQGE